MTSLFHFLDARHKQLVKGLLVKSAFPLINYQRDIILVNMLLKRKDDPLPRRCVG